MDRLASTHRLPARTARAHHRRDIDRDARAVAGELADAGKDVDVVIDYLWPTADALLAIVPRRLDDGHALTWIQVGSVAGLTCPVPSAALRAARLQIIGSGQGSVAPGDILAELPQLAAEVGAGAFDVTARAVPLSDVARAWKAAPTTSDRLVIVP